ncbi:ATP-binding protein [Flavobacterium sp. H122]|uniref:ATP-binding protein n=1 Tax=Flavobacterium sp. H122 TaxID=2529860 RepID=UPI0010A9A5BF|nr:ATP-binding protein [Flavobacterium sp. H122]
MIKIDKLSIYSKLLLLIFIISISFVILFFSLSYYTSKQEEEVYSLTQKQLNDEVNSVMQLNSETHLSILADITYWDELVKFVKSKNVKWFDNVIGSSINMYFVEYLGVYDLQGNEVGSKYTGKIKQPVEFVTASLLEKVYKEKNMNFYVKLSEGFAEVFMGTIHPNNDPEKNKTRPEGYFVMVRLLDDIYVKRLEKITSSEVTFTQTENSLIFRDNFINDDYVLKGWDGKKITNLSFKRRFFVNFKSTENILLIIVVFFVVFLLISVSKLRKWISTPLMLTTKILETGSKKAVKQLKRSPGEFSKIGYLFEEAFSQRKLLEKAKAKAEESDKLKTAFLTNLSHEIRTPMNAIIGFSELLNHKDIDEKEKSEYIEIITKSGNNLVSIIDDLIEMSKIDSNQVVPNLSSVNIDDCVHEIFESVKITIPKSKKMEFVLEKPEEDLPYCLFTDVVKLKQILINLLTNAIKFTDTGCVKLSYEWNKKKNQLEFFIEDTGLGIEKRNQEFIFERFRRVDSDYSIKVGGLGLGLAITKAYVELLGGDIALKSDIGKGSKFKFTLPVMFDKREDSLLEKIEVIKEDVTASSKTKTILIAEDDNINFLLFDKIMRDSNFWIIRANDGEEAVSLFKENPDIDLVLMDIKMPKMSGYEALKEIKMFKSDAVVVAQTAFSSSDEIEKIKHAGFDSHITKPINKEKLFDVISSVLH